MRLSRIAALALASIALTSTTASAQTPPLVEVGFELGGGGGGSQHAVEILVSLSDDGTIPGPSLFDGIVWTPADVGTTVTLTRATDPDLAEAIDRLTNGLADWIHVEAFAVPDGAGWGFSTWEANFLDDRVGPNGVDLGGLEIESIGLRLDALSIETSSNWTDVSLSATLIVHGGEGPPTPEPCGQEPRGLVVTACDDLDDGRCDTLHCSLREAIHEANACTSSDSILIDVGGWGCAIFPLSPLPPITEPVGIDATTQPAYGFAIDGSYLETPADALVLQADGSSIRGLRIIAFPGAAVRIQNASGTRVDANLLGDQGTPVSIGVLIEGGSGHVVGGSQPGQGNRIERPSGSSAEAGIGVELRPGAFGPASGCRIEGNQIRNMEIGVVASGNDHTIGGIAPGAGNAIEGSHFAAVVVHEDAGPSAGNAILGNSFTSSTGLGVDLGFDGPTPNDPYDLDDGANGLQNYPVLISALVENGMLTIAGDLHSTPFTDFRIEVFTSVNFLPAENFLGSVTGMTDAEGNFAFVAGFPWDAAPIGAVTTTATNLATDDTSELSDFVTISQLDRDGDGVPDGSDNCPDGPNASQRDTDGDGLGDVCDPDDDGDGLADADEIANGSDPLDPDSDADGLWDASDSCPLEAPDGADVDADGCTDAIAKLIEIVEQLGLDSKPERGLLAKLAEASRALERGKPHVAANKLADFSAQVEAHRGEKLSYAEADLLIAYAANLIALLP